MKGVYDVEIYNSNIQYRLLFKRNLTIICGNSGTGKTSLIRLINDYYNEGKDSGIKIRSKAECRVLSGKDWYDTLSKINNSIVFLDEGNRFINSKEFAAAIQEFDNYYVLITRQPLHQLSYSVNEIYQLVEKKDKSLELQKTYNTMTRLYDHTGDLEHISPERVLAEDSNSGYEFFDMVCSKKDKLCISANGKGNICGMIDSDEDKITNSLVIADGASFGNEMQRVMGALHKRKNWSLYLPESFEWIILRSGAVSSKSIDIDDILENPSDHIDSKDYVNWERFFTDLLTDILNEYEGVHRYSKNKLNDYFKQAKIVERILDSIKEVEL